MKERIGDICTLKSGTTLKEDILIEDGPIPYVKVSDMNLAGNEKYIVTANSYVDENISEKLIFPKGTVLFPKRGGAIGTNKKRIASKSVCADLNTMGVIPSDRIRPLFLYYFFKSIDFGTLYNGSSVPQINNTDIAPMEINLPSLEEQDKALTQLEKVDFLIQNRVEQLAKLDELIKARFVELFGDVATGDYKYETKKLGDVAEVGSSHRVFTSEFVEDGIPFYRGTEIGELANGQKPTNPYYISEEHYNRLVNDETKPTIGDLLMPSICNKGQVWMVDTEEPFYYKDGRVLRISPDREIYNPKYLQYFMKVKTEVEYPKMGSGSTFAEFKIFLLKNFDVLTPPRTIQDDFTSFVKQVDKSKVAVQKSLEETQFLFDSLMQKYFG